MPQYKVLAVGFHGGRMYSPAGKRPILHVDKPFKETPSWLEAIKPETAAEKKKRLAEEALMSKEEKEKAKQDKLDIADASLVGDGESVIETL